MTAQTTYNTLRTIGILGQFSDGSPHDVAAMRNDEASAEMPFGFAVSFKSTTDEKSADILTAITTEIVAGIVLKHDSYADTQLGTTGVKAGEQLNVVRKGRMYVTCEDGCDVGDRLHVRAVPNGKTAGALLAAASGADTIDSTKQGQWLTSAAAGALAVLDFDFTREID